MPTISYSTNIKNTSHESNIDYNFSNLRFGDRPKVSRPTKKIKDIIDEPSHLDDGWYVLPEISDSNNNIIIPNYQLIQDGGIVAPALTGLSISAVNEIRLDTPLYEKIIGQDPVMGVKSIGSGRNARAFIFRRWVSGS